jgi:hypothetical protein
MSSNKLQKNSNNKEYESELISFLSFLSFISFLFSLLLFSKSLNNELDISNKKYKNSPSNLFIFFLLLDKLLINFINNFKKKLIILLFEKYDYIIFI